ECAGAPLDLHSVPTRRSSDLLESAILAEDWLQVKMVIMQIGNEWSRRKPWISLNNSHRDIQEFTRSLAQLRAYARVEDKANAFRSEEHTSELQSRENLVCRLL